MKRRTCLPGGPARAPEYVLPSYRPIVRHVLARLPFQTIANCYPSWKDLVVTSRHHINMAALLRWLTSQMRRQGSSTVVTRYTTSHTRRKRCLTASCRTFGSLLWRCSGTRPSRMTSSRRSPSPTSFVLLYVCQNVLTASKPLPRTTTLCGCTMRGNGTLVHRTRVGFSPLCLCR